MGMTGGQWDKFNGMKGGQWDEFKGTKKWAWQMGKRMESRTRKTWARLMGNETKIRAIHVGMTGRVGKG